jgi:hypothetical protein
MSGNTVTMHRPATTSRFGIRAQAWLALAALVVAAALLALLLAVQSGPGASAPAVPAHTIVQQQPVTDQSTEPAYLPGRPH